MKKIALKVLDALFLCRLLLLIPVWTVIVLGWITSSSTAVPGGLFVSGLLDRDLWLSLFFFSGIVSSIYIVNQICDVESDRLNNKLFILPRQLISIPTAWFLASISAIIGMAGAFVFFDIIMTLIFASGLLVGVLYNLKPFSLKDRAWGGMIANLLGHGVITYLVGWYGAKDGSVTAQHLLHGVLVSLSAGFANAAVYLTTTIPDAEGDGRVGKKTFAVLYGVKVTSGVAMLLCLLSFIAAFFLEYNSWVMTAPALLSFFLFLRFFIRHDKTLAFQTFRWPVVLLSTFVVAFIPLYAVLLLVNIFATKIYYKKRFNYDYPRFSGE